MKSKPIENKSKKVLICIPAYGKMDAYFVQSFMSMNKPGLCSIQLISNTLISEARNDFAQSAIDNGFDYVFFMDTDMTFPTDALETLLNDNLDIVSGLYFKRVEPYTPIVYKTLELHPDRVEYESFVDYEKDKVQEVAGVGAGCLLIKTSILKECFDAGSAPFDMFGGIGEDFAFCLRAKKLGYKIYCDSRVKCGHLATVLVTEDNHDKINFDNPLSL